VWEIQVESRRTSPSLPNPFSLTARIQGVTVSPPVVELASVPAGVATPVTWTVTNRFGPVRVLGRGGPLGSVVTARPTIANGAHQTYTVVVPAGATRLTVSTGNASDPRADLDLSVFRGATRVGRSAGSTSEETVTLTNPVAATYTVDVHAFAVPAGTMAYDYRDLYIQPALGSVAASATALSLGTGASGTITGSVTALAAPPAGRRLYGEMSVVTDEGAVVGLCAVTIGTVT
jgi:hypothetical protein